MGNSLQIISLVLNILMFTGNMVITIKHHRFEKNIRIAEDKCLTTKDCSDIKKITAKCEKNIKCNKLLNDYWLKKYMNEQKTKENNFREEQLTK